MSTLPISIICPSFNHENYVRFFLQSILDQTFKDFELIIVDDCSSDNNVAEIKKFQDERIKLIEHEYNKGINEALNIAFRHSKGEIVVFCASDDMLEPYALETIYKFHKENNITALYCDLTIIDENNNLRQDLMGNTYYNDNKNCTRYDFLKNGFLYHNILQAPGMSIRREYYEKIYPLPPAFCVLQDYHMHIKLLYMGDVKLISDRLIRYRFSHNQQNISAHLPITAIREDMEVSLLLDTFVQEIKDIELIKKIFAKEIQETKIEPHPEALQYFFGRMALLSPSSARRQWGFRQIMHAYNESLQGNNYLYKIYNFTFKDYLGLTNYCYNDETEKFKAKYKKYKNFFNMSFIVIGILLAILIVIFAVQLK